MASLSGRSAPSETLASRGRGTSLPARASSGPGVAGTSARTGASGVGGWLATVAASGPPAGASFDEEPVIPHRPEPAMATVQAEVLPRSVSWARAPSVHAGAVAD